MNAEELLDNLIDELNRARDLLMDNEIDFELISDIDADLERLFDNRDVIDSAIKNIKIE